MKFFTSDTHFGHGNIINYCNRPFSSVSEMDEELIRRWNEKVGKNDEVYHLGDFFFSNTNDSKYVLDSLNGKIFLVRGNHDSKITAFKNRFEWIKDYFDLKIKVEGESQNIVMMHYAMRIWNKSHHGAWHLYGHSHNSLPEDESLSFDCGVDGHDFYPWSLDEVIVKMKEKERKYGPHHIDHH